MREDLASWTALFTSIARAAHQVLDSYPKLIDDPVVVGLVEGSSKADICSRVEEFTLPEQLLARSIFVLRSRFAEDRLKIAVESGVEQYVVLGAGMDTFAYRQPSWAQCLNIIEVDHPASQARKFVYLRRAGLPIAENVTFCPIDFEKSSLRQGLKNSIFDETQPAFFSWLGVTQYLHHASIRSLLQEIATCATGTGVAFSFVLADHLLSGFEADAGNQFSAMAASRGEPWLSRLEPSQLLEWMGALRFSVLEHARPSDLQKKYFADRSDGLAAPTFEQLMCAWI